MFYYNLSHSQPGKFKEVQALDRLVVGGSKSSPNLYLTDSIRLWLFDSECFYYNLSHSQPGKFREVQAIGWWLEEANLAQISINLTDMDQTLVHQVYEECKKQAEVSNADDTFCYIDIVYSQKYLFSAGLFIYYLLKLLLPG